MQNSIKNIRGITRLLSQFSRSQSVPTKLLYRNNYTYKDFILKLPTFEAGNVFLDMDSSSGIAVISIDNPKAKNAITGSIAVKLSEYIDKLIDWKEGKCVIVCGANDQFCSGGDLKHFMNHLNSPQLGSYMSKYMQDLMLRLSKLPIITVAALQEITLGGGAELAMAFDYRLMQKNSEIAFVQLAMGITTGFGGYTRLVDAVGPQKAMKLLLGAKKMNAQKAFKYGIIEEIFPEDADPVEWSKSWLDQNNLLHFHPQLIQHIKNMTHKARFESLDDSFEYERFVFGKVWQGDLHKEILSKPPKHK